VSIKVNIIKLHNIYQETFELTHVVIRRWIS